MKSLYVNGSSAARPKSALQRPEHRNSLAGKLDVPAPEPADFEGVAPARTRSGSTPRRSVPADPPASFLVHEPLPLFGKLRRNGRPPRETQPHPG